MGRKSKFSREEALTNATKLFWDRGYVNTSLKQLLSAMGIGEGSFYNAFGCKKNLYKECIEHYNATFMKNRNDAISNGITAKDKLFGFFEIAIEEIEQRKGCLFSNSLASEVITDSDLKHFLFDQIDSFLNVLESIITDGKRTGEFRQDIVPRYTAITYFTHLHGFFRISAYEIKKAEHQHAVQIFLKALLL